MSIDLDRLKKAIDLAEQDGPLSTQRELWDMVVCIYNGEIEGKTVKEKVKRSRVYHNTIKHGIAIKTLPAKLGRPSTRPDADLRYASEGELTKALEVMARDAKRWKADDERWRVMKWLKMRLGMMPIIKKPRKKKVVETNGDGSNSP
jgi:hypothetical protein